MSSIASLVRHARELSENKQGFVLATIVDTAGSTYRKAGARMIITHSGDYFGLISGGCLEGDLLLRAGRVFDTGLAEIVEYDMRAEDDLVWGLGLGCNGMIRILLEPISPDYEHPVISGLAEVVENRISARIACSLPMVEGQAGKVSSCVSVYGDASSTSCTDGISEEMREACRDLLANPVDSPHVVTRTVEGTEIQFFLETVDPPVHLLVLGGGPDVLPLSQGAALLGWQVTVLDHRAAYANPDKFPGNVRVARTDAGEALNQVDPDKVSAVLLMSHHFPTDSQYLEQVLQTSIPFIGLLGPRIRGQKLFEQVGADWEKERHRIHAPIGLDIGGETPEAIALSIVAEVQSWFEGREGLPLSTRKMGIHD